MFIWELDKVGKGKISIECLLGVLGESIYRNLNLKTKQAPKEIPRKPSW